MSKAGIKQIALCDAGTLTATPANPILMGIRGGASLEVNPHKEVKDYRERKLRNMVNFKFGVESFQPSMKFLKALINWANNNCDVQIVSTPQTSGGAVDCFQFKGNESIGIDFEYLMNMDKRSVKVDFERAMEYDRAQSFIDGADSTTPTAITGFSAPNTEGMDFNAYRKPYFIAFEAPKGTPLCVITDVIDRKLTIKTKGKKSGYNSSIVDYLTITAELTTRKAGIGEFINAMDRGMRPSILWKEQNALASLYDAVDINSNVLTQSETFKIADDDRFVKLTFEGDVPLYDTSFLFGAANGGDVADTIGAKGGTLKIGY